MLTPGARMRPVRVRPVGLMEGLWLRSCASAQRPILTYEGVTARPVEVSSVSPRGGGHIVDGNDCAPSLGPALSPPFW